MSLSARSVFTILSIVLGPSSGTSQPGRLCVVEYTYIQLLIHAHNNEEILHLYDKLSAIHYSVHSNVPEALCSMNFQSENFFFAHLVVYMSAIVKQSFPMYSMFLWQLSPSVGITSSFS